MPPEETHDSQRMVLTRLGHIAYENGVMTPPAFWKNQLRDIRRELEQGTDWEIIIEERRAGLAALRAAILIHGLDGLTRVPT